MKKLLLFLLFLPFFSYSQDTTFIVDVVPSEYFTGFLTNKGEVLSDVWGGFVGVNRDTIISHGLKNIVQLGGGWHAGVVRDKAGAIYQVYKDNANSGRAGYTAFPIDAYGNPFIGNTDCYAWFDATVTIKNDSLYMFGPDHLGINGGAAITKPMKLPQPPGKRIAKIICMEPGAQDDIMIALTYDNQIWAYRKSTKGVPYLKMTLNSQAVIGSIGQGVFIVATSTDIVAWGLNAPIVGLPWNIQTPTSILATFKKAGLQLPVAEIAGDYNNMMILDSKSNLFSIGDQVHGSTGIGVEFPDWRHHYYGKTAAPWAWNFQVMEMPQPYAMQVPGKFRHVRNHMCQSLHYYAQDLLGNWYFCGRNKAGAGANGREIQNADVFPEWENYPFFIKVNPLHVSWPAGGGVLFDSTKVLPIKMTAGVDQLLTTDTTTLYAMAVQQGGSIASWSWAKISGPGNLSTTTGPIVAVTGLNSSSPTYFQLTAINNFGLSAKSSVMVTTTVSPLPPAPVCKITIDSTIIHSPTSYVRVSGDSSTGAGITYTWTQLSGPSAAISTVIPGSKSGRIFSGLMPGEYGFQLQITDSVGRSSLCIAVVTVVPVTCPTPRVVSQINALINGTSYPVPLSWLQIIYSDQK